MSANFRFISIVGTLVVLVAGFLALLFYFSNSAFRSVEVEPEQVFGKEVPETFHVHSAYITKQGSILELADKESGISLSLVKSPVNFESRLGSLTPQMAFEQVRAYRLGLEAPEELLTSFSVRYASAHFDSRRAKGGSSYQIQLGDLTLDFFPFRVGRDSFFHLGVMNTGSSEQVLILMMQKGQDFPSSQTTTTLEQLGISKWFDLN